MRNTSRVSYAAPNLRIYATYIGPLLSRAGTLSAVSSLHAHFECHNKAISLGR